MTFTFFKFHHDSTRSAGASGGEGPWPPIEKLPHGRLHGKAYAITCPSYAYPVGTVVFDANSDEAN